LACSTLLRRISKALCRSSVPADTSRPTPAALPDHWIADEQWAAGLPGHACDRLGWVWWRGPESAMARSPSPW
jgi:hypothetical protein